MEASDIVMVSSCFPLPQIYIFSCSYLGIYDLDTLRHFTTLEGSIYSYSTSDWADNMPTHDDNNRCVKWEINGKWSNVDCDEQKTFICEMHTGRFVLYESMKSTSITMYTVSLNIFHNFH